MRRAVMNDAEKIAAAMRAGIPGWTSASAKDYVTSRVTGGLTNVLSKVEFVTQASKQANVQANGAASMPPVALVREYGSATSSFMNRVQEENVVKALSKSGLAPTVYASHEWGRVERFVADARALTTKEFASLEFIPRVAELLGKFHALSPELLSLCTVPGTKSLMEDRLLAWLAVAAETRFGDEWTRRKLHSVGVDLLRPEVDWLVHKAHAAVRSPVVFAHGDVQEGNILLGSEGGLHLIDYEYADRFDRGFDLGNAFCEMSMTYAVNAPPGFALNPDDYPSKDVQRAFFVAYAKGAGLKVTEELMVQLQREADVGAITSHLHWAIWAVAMARQHTGISFSYLDYAQQRMCQYFHLKAEHLKQ